MSIPLAIVEVVLLLISIATLLPAGVLFVQLVAAVSQRSARRRHGAGPVVDENPSATTSHVATGRLTVLMPAHDEAGGIEPAIRGVLSQLRAGDRLLVVADNCTDGTANIARSLGAEVIERFDKTRRGKGHALDFGVRWLAKEPPAVVVVVDADCLVAPEGLASLAAQCMASGRPAQALYLMRSPVGAPLKTRVAEFAWIVKNQVRPLGSAVLGAPCQLMGTGMAFPWSVIEAAPLASGHLVEDMELGLALADIGLAPSFCPEARVESWFATDVQASVQQRTRWEHGHLSVITTLGPRLLWRALSRGDAMLAAMVLDLLVPPLASLVLALSVWSVLTAVWALAGGSMAPLAVAGVSLAMVFVGVMAAWVSFGQRAVTLRELLSAPVYVVSKLPIYLRVFTRRQVEWIRTKRNE